MDTVRPGLISAAEHGAHHAHGPTSKAQLTFSQLFQHFDSSN